MCLILFKISDLYANYCSKDRKKKNPKPWLREHTKAVRKIKALVKILPCLNLLNLEFDLIIVETTMLNIGSEIVLKQKNDSKEQIVPYNSRAWSST